MVVWVVVPFGMVVRYQSFRGLCCLYLQGWSHVTSHIREGSCRAC